MKILITFVFLVFLALVVTTKNSQIWDINYGWQSGWGVGPSLTIKSNGTISYLESNSVVTARKVCEEKLDKTIIKRIKKKIDAIPDNISYGTSVTYLDNCFDEKENYIGVTIDGKVRMFAYSQSEKCWAVNVPIWLVELNTELNLHQDAINNCHVATNDN